MLLGWSSAKSTFNKEEDSYLKNSDISVKSEKGSLVTSAKVCVWVEWRVLRRAELVCLFIEFKCNDRQFFNIKILDSRTIDLSRSFLFSNSVPSPPLSSPDFNRNSTLT